MRIVARKALLDFISDYPDSEVAMEDWFERTENAQWDCFADLRRSFNSADYIGNKRVVFNIKGNHYRLVAIVLHRIKMVYIRFIGTHREYDKLIEEQIKDI